MKEEDPNTLDDLVFDTACEAASIINNGGPDIQIAYLIESGWTMEEITAKLKE